jgi:hypothetical protein
MSTALEGLLSLRDSPDRFDTPPQELLAAQIEAANERLESRIGSIPLLANRAETGGVTSISQPSDLVPLLFAHNTYKTYAEGWLVEGQWDRMARWLQTVSTYEIGDQSFSDIDGLDEWVGRLEQVGRFVACSSGTTGKPAILGAAAADLDFASGANVSSFGWATGIESAQDRRFLGLSPRTNVARNEHTRQMLLDAFASESLEPYELPVPPISVESVMAMILRRRRIADGIARAGEVAEFEHLSAERQASMDAAQADAIEALIKCREDKLLLAGFLPALYPLAVGVREQGFTGKDFQSENALFTGGGLKGAQLPPDYRQTIIETFNLSERHVYQLYSMQEINTPFPRCTAARYHAAPWVMVLPLDEPGEHLLDAGDGEIECRAAFMDLSLDGRWGGVISGDRVTVDFGPCACGHQGPTIGPEIVRYADLDGGDKITCAGTIDAYVRGAS